MKKIFFISTLLLLSTLFTFSQEKRSLSLDLGLSQTYKGFFYLYNGVVEFGAAYNNQIVKNLYAGASLHFDYLSRSNSTARTIFYKPKININYNLKVTSWLSINPVVFAGYSFANITNGEYNYAETQKGFNTGTEVKFIWYSPTKFDYYLYGRFDYIYLDKDINFTHLTYFRKVYLTSFGLGVKIKSKE